MFSLHETTKIRICRAAFVAVCVLPTCAVVAWSAFVRTPAYRQAHEQTIAAETGWQARLQRVSSPRPGTLLYEQLELSDRDTRQRLAVLPFVEIVARGEVLDVTLPFPAMINAARLDAFLQFIENLARQWPPARTLRFAAQNLTLHLDSGDQSVTDVVAQLDANQDRTQAKLTFRPAVAGGQAAEPCLLTLTRSHDGASQTIQLATGSTPLPAAALAPLWPGVARFGKTCQFAGRITAIKGTRVIVSVEGHFSGVDLDLLVSRQFPHKLTGLADARLKTMTLEDGRIECAVGSITAGPGVISRSLIQAAETHLHIQAASHAFKGPGNLIPYEQLNVGFEIGPDGMSVRGEVPQTRGALLVDGRRVLAIEPPLVSQPVVDLVRTLVPQSEVHVPATRETAALTSALPIPSIVPIPGDEQPLPHARPVSVNPTPNGTIRR